MDTRSHLTQPSARHERIRRRPQPTYRAGFSVGGGIFAIGTGVCELAVLLGGLGLYGWWSVEHGNHVDPDYGMIVAFALYIASGLAFVAVPRLIVGLVLMVKQHAKPLDYLWGVAVGAAALTAMFVIPGAGGGTGTLLTPIAVFLLGGLRLRREGVRRYRRHEPPSVTADSRGQPLSLYVAAGTTDLST